MRSFLLCFMVFITPVSIFGVIGGDAYEIGGVYYCLDFAHSQAEVSPHPDKYKGNVWIPETIEYGGQNFNVYYIGSNAFRDCPDLEFVSIGNKVEWVQKGAFRGSGIREVVIPENLRYLDEEAFRDCQKLISVSLPGHISNIYENLFRDCISLKEVVISNGIRYINRSAFYNCKSLESITIPESVVSIANDSFYNNNPFSGCSNLSSIIVQEGNSVYDSRNSCDAIIETSSNTLIVGCKNTIIPDDVNTIQAYAFAGQSDLQSIKIPSGISKIGENAFSGCSSLSSVHITNIDDWFKIDFRSNNFPMYSNPLYYGQRLFVNDSEVMGLVVPNEVSSINKYAFINCSSINSLMMQENVSSVGFGAFYGCKNISSIVIPNSLVNIGERAFENCSNLKIIKSFIKEPYSIKDNVFNTQEGYSIYETAFLYVPYGTKTLYQSKTGWKKFQNIIEMEDENAISGDANGDGQINGLDVVQTVDYIVNQTYKLEVDLYPAGNPDGVINGMDLVELVELVMSQDGSQNAPAHQKTNK